MTKIPQNANFLERAIRSLVGTNEEAYRLRVMMANVIVGQFLRDGVARGGTSMKLRYGNSTTRFTMDFDVARRTELKDFIEEFAHRLEEGWGAFDGTIAIAGEKHPKGVPAQYVMHPYDVKLRYRHHPWCTVRFEVSYDEIGDADEVDLTPVPSEIREVFEKLGFPAPSPVPLMTIPYQIAQKLHGLSEPGSVRAQDLIDLQLIMRYERPRLMAVRRICQRLFANRKLQPWPAQITKGERWESVYGEGAFGLSVLPTVDEAIAWANDLIVRIANS